MREKNTAIHLAELFSDVQKADFRQTGICCFLLDADTLSGQENTAVLPDEVFAVLVLSGTANAHINHKAHALQAGSLMVLSAAHLLRFADCDEHFRARCLCVSRAFMHSTDPAEMIYLRTKYGVQLYNNPVVGLQTLQQNRLEERMNAVQREMDNIEHLYRDRMMLSAIIACFLDISDMVEKNLRRQAAPPPTCYENLTKQFVDLLQENYLREHTVDFYADRLHISTHYLSRIVKRTTGRTAGDLIFGMLYAEARALLSQSELSVRQIADRLHFSDPSAFGKFFKRKSGCSPKRYRAQG